MGDMTARQVGLIVGGGGLLAAWLAVAGAPVAERTPQPAEAPSVVVDPVTADIRRQTARLHAYMDRLPPRPEPTRNPFRFAREPADSSGIPDRAPSTSGDSMVPMAPASPSLRLIGIAESRGLDGTVRTAILAGPSGTQLVVTGDELASRFLVGSIGAETVELIDLDDGVIVTLALR